MGGKYQKELRKRLRRRRYGKLREQDREEKGRAGGFRQPAEEKLAFGGEVKTFVDGIESQFQTI
jgi:hypothetical protein